MKKIIYVLAVLLLGGNANAAIRSIVDWDGGSNPYQPGNVSVSGENLKTKCSAACPGYDLKTTTCSYDQKLVHCSVPGCGYYNKCVALSSEELKDPIPDPLETIDVDEIYNEIVEEQKEEQELQDTIDDIRNSL
jgi:hypothetical protein